MRIRASVLSTISERLKVYKPLIPPIFIWVVLFITFQNLVPYFRISKCHFHNPQVTSDQQIDEGYKILVIADPQLIDNHTYPSRSSLGLSFSRFTVDNYIKTNFEALMNQLVPDAVIFVGDLMDNGRESLDDYYENEFSRFNKVFQFGKWPNAKVHYSVPGNHDIGWENGVTLDSLNRYKSHFGTSNKKVVEHGHELIFLDTISLSNTETEEIHGPPHKFLDSLENDFNHDNEVGKLPRILFTHVPLFRDPKVLTCGPYREAGPTSFPIVRGYQYQTVISEELSKEILTKVKPQLTLGGDDHDYCEIERVIDESTGEKGVEVTVKSISMAMGIWKPAVELLTLFNDPLPTTDKYFSGKTFAFSMCKMPVPYQDVIFYVSFSIVNGIYILFLSLDRAVVKYVGIMETNDTLSTVGSGTGAMIADYFKRIDWLRVFEFAGIEFIVVLVAYWMLL